MINEQSIVTWIHCYKCHCTHVTYSVMHSAFSFHSLVSKIKYSQRWLEGVGGH